MKKNLFKLFLDKILEVPFWVKQVIYLHLSNEMKAFACEDFLKNHNEEIFATFVPTLTYKGKTELTERTCGLDTNIYNFLQCCANGMSILEISINTFLSMEEVAKYYEFCVEQTFIKNPESIEIYCMAGYISGKFRTGEYFKQKGIINIEQLRKAILTQKDLNEKGEHKKFGEVLISLGYITEDDLKAVLILKDEAQKRFILDHNVMPKPEVSYTTGNQKYEKEIEDLKEENSKLKRKMLQLLDLVKQNSL